MKKYLLLLTSLAVTTAAMSQQISLTNFNTEVFIENFSANSTQFSFENSSENYFTIDDGDLFLSRNNKLSDYTIFSSTPFNEENYKLKTSIKLIPTSSKETYVGILLNTQLDGNGLVSVEFNTKKEYRVRQINNGDSKYLSGNRENEGWIANDFIKENGEYNYIDVVCYKGRYDIYFNFQYVNTFESPEYTAGRFGFLIGAQSQARIDYVHVHKEGGKVSKIEFNNANDKILKLENDILSFQKDIKSKQVENDKLKIENSNFSKELVNKDQNKNILIAEKQALENDILSLQKDIKSKQTVINRLNVENSSTSKELINKDQKETNLLAEKQTLENKVSSLQKDLKSKQTTIDQLKIKNTSSTKELVNKDQKQTNLLAEKKSLENKVKDLEQNELALNEKLDLVNKAKNKIDSESSDFKKAILSYETISKNLKVKNKELTTQLDGKIIDIGNIQASLSNSNKKYERETIELNRKIVSQDKQLNKANADLKKLNGQLKSLNNQITSFKNSNKIVEDEKRELNRKIVNQSKQIKTQESKVSDLNSKINSIITQKEKRETDLNDQLKKEKSESLKKQETISLLNSKNKSLNDSLSSLSKDNSLLLIKEKELNELKEKHNELSLNNQDGLARIEELNFENKKLDTQLEEQKQIAAQFAESYRYELEKSKRFQEEIRNYQSELTLESTKKKNVIYKVQLGMFNEEINIEGLELLTKINTENNQFIYLSGRFENYSSARNYLLKVNELGFKNAFIVKF